jgi:hypothetical protein
MNAGQYSKRVAERPVDHVPQMKHPVGLGEKRDLGRHPGALARELNDRLNIG